LADASEEMRNLAAEMAINNPGRSTCQIWGDINKIIDKKYQSQNQSTKKISKNMEVDVVENSRKQLKKNEDGNGILMPKYRILSKDDLRLFLKHNIKYEIPDPNEFQKNILFEMLIWNHPDLLPILRRQSITIQIDGTFRCVPSKYKQCIVIMAHDDETDMNLPIIFSLMQD
jgi:hypothetical protein